MFCPSIFRANDIRGVYGKDFSIDFTKDLAFAFVHLLSQPTPKILIGHDSRLSSPELSEALKKYFLEAGAEVACIGLAPSPLCYFLLHHYNFTATVVVTASHNPKNFNGFKLMLNKNLKKEITTKDLKKVLEKDVSFNKRKPGAEIFVASKEPYIESLKKEFSLRPVNFVVDAGHGALGPLCKQAYKSLGLDPYFLFCDPDGHFPKHSPDPTCEENLSYLKNKIKETGSSFGFGFDGDGDRIVLVTSEERFLHGDEFGFLFIESLLAGKNKKIVVDVKCSNTLIEEIKKRGGVPIISKSGHRLSRKTMEEEQACFAIEFSGHIFFKDRPYRGFDDGLYASLRLIELLERKGLKEILPKAQPFKTPEMRIDMPVSKQEEVLQKIQNYLNEKQEKFLDLDGIRISRETSWALARSSKTQEVLSLRFEASSEQELEDLKKEFLQFTQE